MLKVAILGTVPAHRILAPFKDESWEIWVCSPGNRGDHVIPRITRWFELHAIQSMRHPECFGWAPEYFAWLKSKAFPVYMQEPNDDEVPQALVFPYKDVLKCVGTRLPFTSSISWMIGYALLLGAEEIGVFGVDMAATQEHYSGQKYGCLQLFEICHERGVKVQVPLESSLATYPPLYGYDEATRMGRSLYVKKMEIQKGIDDLTATIDRLMREREFFKGAQENNEFILRTFIDGEDAEIDGVETIQPEPPAITEAPPHDFGAYQYDKGSGLLVPKANGQGEEEHGMLVLAGESPKRRRSPRTPDDPRPDVMRSETEMGGEP